MWGLPIIPKSTRYPKDPQPRSVVESDVYSGSCGVTDNRPKILVVKFTSLGDFRILRRFMKRVQNRPGHYQQKHSQSEAPD
jgi:hypothetical protein